MIGSTPPRRAPRFARLVVALSVGSPVVWGIGPGMSFAADAPDPGPPLVHSVVFVLKDRSSESRAALVASAKEHLDKQPGASGFAVGPIAESVDTPINDRSFDVMLQVVFDDKAAFDAFSKGKAREAFLAENRPRIARLTAFDWYLATPKPLRAEGARGGAVSPPGP